MIRPAFSVLTVVAVLIFLAACGSDEEKPHKHPFGYNPDQPNEVNPEATPPGPPNSLTGDTGPIAPTPPPPPPPGVNEGNPQAGGSPPAPVEKHDYPYAQPVQGKPGFVTSPYAPEAGYVDVRGFPPGTEVKDPYTQKIFLVP